MSMKEWGKRNFSNDWTHRFKGKKSIVTGGSSSRSEERSRSRDFARPGPLSSKHHPPQKSSHAHGCTSLLATILGSSFILSNFFLDENGNRKFTFPSRKKEPPEPLQLNSFTGEYYPRTGTMSASRSRAHSLRSTPSGRRTQYTVQNNAATPTRSLLRLPLQRSNSQGGPSLNYTYSLGVSNNIPRSAKKWGRTAHLHEVRGAVPHSVFSSTGGGSGQRTKKGSSERPGPKFDHDRARPSREFEYDSEDVFSVPRPISAAPRRDNKDDNGTEDEVTVAGPGLLFNADLPVDDGDPWVDTDSVGSESGTDLAANGEF